MDITEKALQFIKNNDCNFYASDIKCPIKIFGHAIDVESIWHSKKEKKIYIHCGCEEFEGDLDIESLSDENQKLLLDVFEK